MVNILKEMRIKHWVKNCLTLLPLLCSGNFVHDHEATIKCFVGWIGFGFLASSIYVINDIVDCEKDKMHPKKKFRPIASGKMSIQSAVGLAVSLVFLAIISNVMIGGSGQYAYSWFVFLAYYIVNLLYSIGGLKKIPLLDIVLLVSGFLLRVLYGSIITEVPISMWLYLVVVSGAFYLGFGKRRNELDLADMNTRDVLRSYSADYIDKMLTVCMTLALTFYSLWCVETVDINNRTPLMYVTIPLLMIIFFLYTMILDSNSDGDPVDVILTNKKLLLLIISFVIIFAFGIYL